MSGTLASSALSLSGVRAEEIIAFCAPLVADMAHQATRPDLQYLQYHVFPGTAAGFPSMPYG